MFQHNIHIIQKGEQNQCLDILVCTEVIKDVIGCQHTVRVNHPGLKKLLIILDNSIDYYFIKKHVFDQTECHRRRQGFMQIQTLHQKPLRVSKEKQKDRQDPALGMYTIIYSSIIIPLMTIQSYKHKPLQKEGGGGHDIFLRTRIPRNITVCFHSKQ